MWRVVWLLVFTMIWVVGAFWFSSPHKIPLWWTSDITILEDQPIDCDLIFLSGGVMMDPDCLSHEPPFLAEYFSDTVDNRWDDIVWWSDEYQLYSWSFVYTGAVPIFSGELQDFAMSLDTIDEWTWLPEQLSWDQVILTYEQYDVWRLMHFSYYVVRREKLDELWPCSRTNYDVAMIAIDTKYLPVGDEFNVNNRVAYRIGYCGSASDYDNFAFQSGVCGASSQVFRTALIHPDLEVLERHPHRIWYERYYDTTIWGDDAAIIERRKQLRIQNTWPYPIYFRTHLGEKSGLLVAISPYQDDLRVRVERSELDDLVGHTSTTTYSGSGDILYQTWWVSEYVMRESGIVN